MTERELARIYKGDYRPMSPELIDGIITDTYVWYDKYCPNVPANEIHINWKRMLGLEEDTIKKKKPPHYKGNNESGEELIERLLKERRDMVET